MHCGKSTVAIATVAIAWRRQRLRIQSRPKRRTSEDIIQRVINRLKEWCDKWLVSVNANKCNQVSYTAKHKIDTDYYISNNNTKHFIESVDH